MKLHGLRRADSTSCLLVAMFSVLPATLLCPGVAAGMQKLEPGDAVGDFKLRDIEGNEVDTSTWRERPVVWLFVGASQKSSEEAIRQLQEVVDEFSEAKKVVRAAVLTGDVRKISYFRQLSKLHDVRVPIVLDDQRDVYGRLGVIVLPTTVLVDREGKLHRVLPGHTLDYQRKLRAHLAYLAGELEADELELALNTRESRRDRERERAERLCQSANILLRRRLPQEAEDELRRAIEADPSYTRSYLRLAELIAARGQFDEAEKLVETVRQREPDNHHTKLTLGVVRLRQNRIADAEALLKQALILNPDPVRTNYWLGRVYEERGLSEKAASHYRAAVERLAPAIADGAGLSPGSD